MTTSTRARTDGRIYILVDMLSLNFEKKFFWSRCDYPDSASSGAQKLQTSIRCEDRGILAHHRPVTLNIAVAGMNERFPDGAYGKASLANNSVRLLFDYLLAFPTSSLTNSIPRRDVQLCEDSRRVLKVFDTSTRYGHLDLNGLLCTEVTISLQLSTILLAALKASFPSTHLHSIFPGL